MIIASASVNMAAKHRSQESSEIRERLRVIPAAASLARRSATASRFRRPRATRRQMADRMPRRAIEAGIEAAENDPVLSLIRAMLAKLLGREVEVFNVRDLAPASDATLPAADAEAPEARPAPARRQQLRSMCASSTIAKAKRRSSTPTVS